jgi:hypothetical protein
MRPAIIGLSRTVAKWSGLLRDDQGHFADVPAGQVRGLEGLLGGHGMPDGLAEPVPGVGARVREAGDAVGDVAFAHGWGSFRLWEVAPVLVAFWHCRFRPA